MSTTTPCYLGIDVGTQGLTALLVDSSSSSCSSSSRSNESSLSDENKKKSSLSSLNVLAMGEGSYGFVPNLPEGCYEQDPKQWEKALLEALISIRDCLLASGDLVTIDAICVTGQMHGCCMIDKDGNNIGTARLWCDARNQEEADELSELFGLRIPKRLTTARYLWSLKHEPYKASKCVGITTPAGYITHKLTTSVTITEEPLSLLLGVGEASGVFPIDDSVGGGGGCVDYRNDWIEAFDEYVRTKLLPAVDVSSIPYIRDLLPKVRVAGDIRNNHCDWGGNNNDGLPVVLNRSILDETNGWLYEVRELFGSNTSSSRSTSSNSRHEILVAPAEGDQPTALAASLIGRHGMISCSFGTSVVANMVGKVTTTSSSSNGSSISRSNGTSESNNNNNNKNNDNNKKSSAFASSSVDRFNAVNGQPISMVWLRNGTTYINKLVESYGNDFDNLLRQAIVEAPIDCGGLLALPFLDDEPGLNVARGGTGMIVGFNSRNHQPGNIIKAALVSVMFNLYLGTQQVEQSEAEVEADDDEDDDEVEDEKDKKDATTTATTESLLSFATTEADDTKMIGSMNKTKKKEEIVLTGGLTKTPMTGQILANIFNRPVRLFESSDEGGAWGASLLAKYYHEKWLLQQQQQQQCRRHYQSSSSSFSSTTNTTAPPPPPPVSPPPPHPNDWIDFLTTIEVKEQQMFVPQSNHVPIYQSMLIKYKKLLDLQPQLDRIMNDGP